jgi:hypothetical protein
MRMRGDIRPLCDKDGSQMVARQVQFDMGLSGYGGTKPVFLCIREDCQRRYDFVQGYHTVVGGQIRHDTGTRRCPEDQGAMFVGLAPSGGMRVWMCAQFGCGQIEGTGESGGGSARE